MERGPTVASTLAAAIEALRPQVLRTSPSLATLSSVKRARWAITLIGDTSIVSTFAGLAKPLAARP